MLVRCHCGCHSVADVLVELSSRLLEHPTGLGARPCSRLQGYEGPADSTARDRSGMTRLSRLGATLQQRDGAPSLAHVDMRSFCAAVFRRMKNRALLVRSCQENFLSGLMRLFPVSVTCSKYVKIYVLPVELSKLSDNPIEATSEKF